MYQYITAINIIIYLCDISKVPESYARVKIFVYLHIQINNFYLTLACNSNSLFISLLTLIMHIRVFTNSYVNPIRVHGAVSH